MISVNAKYETGQERINGMIGPMMKILKQKLTKKLQEIFWIRITFNHIISGLHDFKIFEPRIKCSFIPITMNNFHRVGDFREDERVSQYKNKLVQKEIGYFVEYNGQMISSIWATINKAEVSNVVRNYIRLMPNEGLIHDIVTGKQYRGMGVGSFMVSRIALILLKEYGLNRIIIDVNIKNRASLRMMNKVGLRIDHKMLYVTAFGRLVFQLVLKQYT
jgi:GNAT superfamily N-acetyltransferase